jgi:L-threonylcarbamoyladenylate synthase
VSEDVWQTAARPATMRRVVVDPVAPDPESVKQAADAIRAGGCIALPTDTLYGLAVNPFDATAVEKLFAVKGRESGRAVALIAADAEQVVERVGPLPPTARALATRFWPGPLTLILPAPRDLVPAVSSDGTVGVRVPDHAVARALCRAAGFPLTATSANISGGAATSSPDVVAGILADRIDLLVDAGPTPGGSPSTLVDVTGPAPRLVRAGAVAWADIQSCLEDDARRRY